jgi:hypothetical protein
MSRKVNRKLSPKNYSSAIKIVTEAEEEKNDMIKTNDLTVEVNFGSYIEQLQNGKTFIIVPPEADDNTGEVIEFVDLPPDNVMRKEANNENV